MFIKYKYNPSSTLANVMADVEKVITGETNLGALSADCDVANSQIWSDTAAGWALYDSAAGTNKRCYRALRSDSSTVYTYVTLDYNTSNSIIMSLHESWNATTHTGTNSVITNTGTNTQQRLSLTVGGNLYIGASVDYMYLMGEYSGVYGTNGSQYNGHLTVNCARRMSWDTDANALPTTILISMGLAQSSGGCQIPRFVDIAGTSVVSTISKYMYPSSKMGYSSSQAGYHVGLPIYPRQAVTNKYFIIKSFYSSLTANSHGGFSTGEIIAPIYLMAQYGNMADTIIGHDGKTYFVERNNAVNAAQGTATLIPRY